MALGLDYVFDNEEVVADLKAHPEMFGGDADVTEVPFVAPKQIRGIADCLKAIGYAPSDIA